MVFDPGFGRHTCLATLNIYTVASTFLMKLASNLLKTIPGMHETHQVKFRHCELCFICNKLKNSPGGDIIPCILIWIRRPAADIHYWQEVPASYYGKTCINIVCDCVLSLDFIWLANITYCSFYKHVLDEKCLGPRSRFVS